MFRFPILTFLIFIASLTAACTSSEPPIENPPDCNGIFYPVATRPMQSDPDIFSPPTPAPEEGESTCPTPVASPTPLTDPADGFIGGNLSNLTINPQDQELKAVAIGDDMLALGWLEGSEGMIALARGGNYLNVQTIGNAQDMGLAFSRANRAHVAYEVDGELYYRIADGGEHPALFDPIYVDEGTDPQVAIDEANWAFVIFERDGVIRWAKHIQGDQWLPNVFGNGIQPTVVAFYDSEKDVFGIPGNNKWFGLLVGANRNGAAAVFRYLSWFNWPELLIEFPVPAGEELLGTTHLDYLDSPDPASDAAWVYASWVTIREATDPPPPTVIQPQFAPSNPLAPTAVANPAWVYADFNSARMYAEDATFDAALYQQVDVGTGNAVTFSAWGQCWSSEEDDPATSINPANCRLAVGIDAQGGVNPNSPDVVWSGEQSPLNTFSQLSINTMSQEDTVTLFMRAQPDASKAHNEVYWDEAEITAGTLANGDFEGTFSAYNGNTSLTVPDGWTPVFEDDSYTGPPARDVYTIYSAYSSDGGATWGSPFIVTQNNSSSTGTTGAIAAAAYPLISFETDPPSVTFFYIYASGDPPPDTQFLSFGRPYAMQCELGTDVCNGDNPGQPLFSRQVVRPSYSLLTVRDPFNGSFGLLAWESLQEDYENKDIFTTYAIMR